MSVKIVEVGPRDGLQNEVGQLSVADKVAFIEDLSAAGLTTIEVGAFVSPKWVPQMADSGKVYESVIKHMPHHELPMLVPNMKGYERAKASGVKHIAIFTAASETFCQKNMNMTIAQSLESFKEICEQAKKDNVKVRGYVSTVVACPYEGDIDPSRVREVTQALFSMGCDEVSLGDTIGVGTPKSIHDLLDVLLKSIPAEKLALHCHDTYGQAIANIAAGYSRGIRIFDSAAGGLGGCPYAPGAGGNVATEDVVYFFSGEEVKTGVDLPKLVHAANTLCQKLDKPIQSKVGKALLSKKESMNDG